MLSTFVCVECEEDVNPKRWELGYRTCLACGAVDASKETEEKSQRVALAYNKGNYQYFGPKANPKDFGLK